MSDVADNEEEEEEEDEEEEEEDEDEQAEFCPTGCDQGLYDKMLDFREKKADAEDYCQGLQKAVDDLKKQIDRLKSREKQINKDMIGAELEMQQFQQQKQAGLNQISVMVPLSISQIYAFEDSGVTVNPPEKVAVSHNTTVTNDAGVTTMDQTERSVEHGGGLQTISTSINSADITQVDALNNGPVSETRSNDEDRSLVADMDMKSSVLLQQRELNKLYTRVLELYNECDSSRGNFRELRKDRVRLSKDCDTKRESIEGLKNKCTDLQALKFGKVIDIDELEAGSDRTVEEQLEKVIADSRGQYVAEIDKLVAEQQRLEEELYNVTKQNSEKLSSISQLAQTRLDITRELNEKGDKVSKDSKFDDLRDKDERKRLQAYVQLQQREIEALKTKIFVLKRKTATSIFYPTLPYPVPSSSLIESSATGSIGLSFTQSQYNNQSEINNSNNILPPIIPK